MQRPEFPLAAVAGAEEVKLALRLLAIDPLLKGLLIRGGRGSGKTLLARSLRGLVPEGAPFVEIPANVTEDRLLGGVDWSAMLAAGEPRVSTGLLEQASQGVLFIDHMNLLSAWSAAHVARALDSAMLVGSYDPDDGEPAALLRDAVGLRADLDGGRSVDQRGEIVARTLAFQSGADGFVAGYASETARAKEGVCAARQLLSFVIVDEEGRRRLCEIASRLGVEGHRAEIFAIRAARAHAALCGRQAADESDLQVAVRLTLEPRAKDGAASAERGAGSEPERSAGTTSNGAPDSEHEVPPIDNPAPALPEPLRRACAAPGGGRKRRRGESESSRGRYVRAVPADPGHGVIAVEATLRAAAPFQKIRQRKGKRVRILASDLRFKQFRRKTGIEIIIALDASGSMAANRIQQAKGAIVRLLREAYLHRDIVALVGFRGDRAEVLMKPGRSVELANRALDELPAGGGTPLAAGVLLALDLVRRATRPTLLVLLTDGRPNVSCTGDPVWPELERVAVEVRESASVALVVDTSRGWSPSAGAARLASMMGARCVALPRLNASGVYAMVAEAAAAMRERA